jgi:hypothetical protein
MGVSLRHTDWALLRRAEVDILVHLEHLEHLPLRILFLLEKASEKGTSSFSFGVRSFSYLWFNIEHEEKNAHYSNTCKSRIVCKSLASSIQSNLRSKSQKPAAIEVG